MNNNIFVACAVLAATLVLMNVAGAEESANTNPLEADMVEIPAGMFVFGTDEEDEAGEALSLGITKPWFADENPRQKIFLKRFYIDRYEVTNKRYKVFVDDLGAIPPENWKHHQYPDGQGDFPVVWVNWFDAANFCSWADKRLPTEKEWEKAARGAKGNIYPWGNTFENSYANLPEKAGSKITVTTVGAFPQGASPYQVQDMIGNVWEWTEDDYEPYKGSVYKSPYYEQGMKVTRGASVSDVGHFPSPLYLAALARFARAGYRQHMDPEDMAPDLGFRCASTEKTPAMKVSTSAGRITSSNSPSGEPGSSASKDQKGSSDLFRSPVEQDKELSAVNPFEAKPNLPTSGMMVLIFLSFVAGVFSFLSPCTLPILPAYFAVTAQAERARMSIMSIAFFFGLATLFILMGASASFLGQALREYMFSMTTWGGIAVVIFGIMTLFGKGFSGAHFRSQPASTLIGSYLFGATFALGWTPCVGPVLSGILILAASDKTIFQGMSLLFFYAIGLGLPLILISTFCGHLSKDGLFWRILRGKGWDVKIGNQVLMLHTTNLFSGLLLILLGWALAVGYITYINSLIPIEMQVWFSALEEKILHWFM